MIRKKIKDLILSNAAKAPGEGIEIINATSASAVFGGVCNVLASCGTYGGTYMDCPNLGSCGTFHEE